ncbi:MAG: prepilin-type N-terminal cleavage/methylation domain-containing protein [Planctomycetota bacterium]
MRNERHKNGFTLVELLLALVITGIVTAAVATLAFALNSANDLSDNMSEKQAYLRFAALKISDLVRQSKLVCYASTDEVALWKEDKDPDGPGGPDMPDGKINIDEVVYIECGSAQNHLRLCEFTPLNSTAINPGSIRALSTNWWTAYSSTVNYTTLIPQCSNVQFGFLDALPTSPKFDSRFVTISYDIVENGTTRKCQISATLRGRAENLLDASGNIVSDDD